MKFQRLAFLSSAVLFFSAGLAVSAGSTDEEGLRPGVRILERGVRTSEHLRNLSPTAPTFIDEQNVWVDAQNRLRILCPHPNSDGLDPSGEARLEYVIRIMRDCTEYYSTSISKSLYPYIFSLSFEIPFDDYSIIMARRTGVGKKKATSPGTVIIGPTSGSSASSIPSNCVEIDRWLLHVPKVSGGFTGRVAFNNRFPELPARVWVAGFDASGNIIEGTQTPLIVVGQKPEIGIYGSTAAGEALFNQGLQDQISHIAIMEENQSRLVDLSITYQNLDPTSLTATVEETDLRDGTSVGSQFILEARKSAEYWDGVAVLNLTQVQSSVVQAVFRSASDHHELARIDLGQVGAGEKALFVLSDLFAFRKDAYYTLETTDPTQKIQVLGLRGSSGADSPLLVGSSVFKSK